MDEFYGNRNALHRFLVSKADDSGEENYLDLTGLAGHSPTKVLHIQPHGFSSVPMSDAHLIGLRMGLHDDMLVALGGEKGSLKPTSLGAGNTAIYNADGSIMKLIGKNGAINADGDFAVTVKSFTIKCGGVTLSITNSGVAITGGTVTNDGHAIDKTHQHLASGGTGIGGPPQ